MIQPFHLASHPIKTRTLQKVNTLLSSRLPIMLDVSNNIPSHFILEVGNPYAAFMYVQQLITAWFVIALKPPKITLTRLRRDTRTNCILVDFSLSQSATTDCSYNDKSWTRCKHSKCCVDKLQQCVVAYMYL